MADEAFVMSAIGPAPFKNSQVVTLPPPDLAAINPFDDEDLLVARPLPPDLAALDPSTLVDYGNLQAVIPLPLNLAASGPYSLFSGDDINQSVFSPVARGSMALLPSPGLVDSRRVWPLPKNVVELATYLARI